MSGKAPKGFSRSFSIYTQENAQMCRPRTNYDSSVGEGLAPPVK